MGRGWKEGREKEERKRERKRGQKGKKRKMHFPARMQK